MISTWEQRKLGELVKEGILEAPLDGNHGEKHPTSDEYVDSGIPFLMASDIHNGEVNIYSCKYITKERAERLDKGFARNGDVLLTHKATIGETAILSNLMTEYAMLTPQVTYYRIKNEERLNREYLYSFFNSLDFQTELKTKAAQSTRPYIGITAQQNLKIILPAEIDEQIRIGLYFRNLDHLITLHQRKLEHVKKMKKSMLQKMFPKKNQLYPEVRFPGFTDAWEQRKLGEIATYRNGKAHEANQLDVGTYELVNLNSISIDGGLKPSGKFIEDGSDTLQRNDLVMVLSDVGHGDLLGRVAIIPENNRYVLNQRVALLRINDDTNTYFLFSIINRYQDYFKKLGAGSSQLNISRGIVENFEVAYPNVAEQRMIADYFQSLDHLITLHQRELDHLQLLKKGMLQQMFI